jgi:hypothetical protein
VIEKKERWRKRSQSGCKLFERWLSYVGLYIHASFAYYHLRHHITKEVSIYERRHQGDRQVLAGLERRAININQRNLQHSGVPGIDSAEKKRRGFADSGTLYWTGNKRGQ